MKCLGVVLAMVVSGACSGATEVDDADETEETAEVASSFEALHGADAAQVSRAPRVRQSLRRGAARIADLQADTIGDNAHNGLTDVDPDDGGWDFIIAPTATAHSPAASPPNLFGATGLGVWAAIHTGAPGNRLLATTLDVGLGLQHNAAIDSPPDFVFGVLLAELADNPGFAELARQRYDAKRAAAGGAAGLGTRIRDGRHAGGNDGLIPYDLGWLTLGAAALDTAFPGAGYGADADVYAGIVLDDLRAATPLFDLEDAREEFYVTGLAWALVSASWQGANATFRRARALLLQHQRADGAWGTNADQPAPDLQATAHALQGLALSGRMTERARVAGRRAARWLLGQQAASGGWPDAANLELPLVDADIVLGLMLSQTRIGREDGVTPDGFQPRLTGAPARYATPGEL